MNSSAQLSRRIASNLLWTPQGIVRNPLVEVAPDGRILSVRVCDTPDRSPFTEFHAGLLVAGFPDDYEACFARMSGRPEPLPELLAELFAPGSGYMPAGTASAASDSASPAPGTVLVVVSGLDYDTLRLTASSQIRRIP